MEEKLPPHDEKSFFYEKIYVVIQYKYKKFVYSFHSHMIMVLEGFASWPQITSPQNEIYDWTWKNDKSTIFYRPQNLATFCCVYKVCLIIAGL